MVEADEKSETKKICFTFDLVDIIQEEIFFT